MTDRNFLELLHARRADGHRLCVGLDPDTDKMDLPPGMPSFHAARLQLRRCEEVVDATKDIALAYKPNAAFFSGMGGWRELIDLIDYIKRVAPDVPIILDFKRGDIGNTNKGYVNEAFSIYQADAITVHPYLGYEAMAPFLADPNKFAFVLCKTSNSGSGEFQNLQVQPPLPLDRGSPSMTMPFYLWLAYRIRWYWNNNGNVGLVVGATFPEQLEEVRSMIGPDMEILVPGVGTQGGDVEATVRAGGEHIVVNASSSIMFPQEGESIRSSALMLGAALLETETRIRPTTVKTPQSNQPRKHSPCPPDRLCTERYAFESACG